jgi:hypothetical protein
MSKPDGIPKLRMAPEDPRNRPKRLPVASGARRPRSVNAMDLEHSLAPFRVGSVPYLNAAYAHARAGGSD